MSSSKNSPCVLGTPDGEDHRSPPKIKSLLDFSDKERKEIYYRIFSNYSENWKTDCWEWKGRLNEKGYGVIDLNGTPHRVHRLSYELENGPNSDNLMVCHSCDNPKCINPKHLFLGTARDNTWDMILKGRATWQK